MAFTRFMMSLLMGFSRIPKDLDTISEEPNDVIRVCPSASGARLETAILRYRHADGTTVDLVGAIHLGSSGYFRKLNRFLKTPSIVLFEMVGGESLGSWQVPSPTQDPLQPEALGPPVLEPLTGESENHSPPLPTKDWLNHLYQKCAVALGLELQTDWIDYGAENFFHADLDHQTFVRERKLKGESIWSFVFGQKGREKDQKPTKNKATHKQGIIRPWKFWSAALHPSPTPFRQLLIQQMALNSGLFQDMDSDSVILGKRNERCIEIFDQQRSLGHEHLAILFGAAHLPDLGQELEKRGFGLVDKTWLVAWE